MYTVGIKRRFWFGFREVQVNSHGWQDGRIILNLVDGSQEQIPGYAVYCLKVYNDFHTHADSVLRAQEEKARRVEVAKAQEQKELEQLKLMRELEDLKASKRDVVYREPVQQIETPPPPTFQEDMDNEVIRRATQRINSLLA